MEKKKIILSTQEELRIFMSPQRQSLLRILGIAGKAMTAKELAVQMKISASSAQLHIRKLVQLGVLEKDHTERINGITATYYRLSGADVFIGLRGNDALFEERDAVVQNLMMQVYKNSRDALRSAPAGMPLEEVRRNCCDSRSGIFYLRPEDAAELEDFIDRFLREKGAPREGAAAWEWSFILYNTTYRGEKDERGIHA